MSRRTPEPHSKFKISNPQPYQAPSRFPPTSYSPGPSSTIPLPGSRKPSTDSVNSVTGYAVPPAGMGMGTAPPSTNSGRSSPARPVRSVRRGPPGASGLNPQTGSPLSDDGNETFTPMIPPVDDGYHQAGYGNGNGNGQQPYYGGQPQQHPSGALRRPSATGHSQQPSYSSSSNNHSNQSHQYLSANPNGNGNGSGPFSDDDHSPGPSPANGQPPAHPWEMDRTARTQMIEHQREQATNQGKLRNVVGAFMAAGQQGAQRDQRRPSEGRRPSGGRRGGGDGNGEEGMMLGYGGREFDGVDSVIRKIQRDFPDILDKDFAPTSLALSLLSSDPSSSSGPSLPEFLSLHQSLSQTLSSAVQTHYQVYAASLPAHANLAAALQRAQTMVKETKKSLKESRDLLGGGAGGLGDTGAATGKRAEMGMLWQRERALKNMLKQLDAIENLRSVPDKMETLVGDKRFLQAALVLVRSIKMVNREELLEVPALIELRVYLSGQLGALTDILVEELHNHLYLKTFYTDNRWLAYQKGQTTLSLPKDSIMHEPAELDGSSSDGEHAKPKSRLSRYLRNLALRPTRHPMLDTSDEELFDISQTPTQPLYTRNGTLAPSASVQSISGMLAQQDGSNSKVSTPEADSFSYMETLLESLAALGKLGYALEVVGQRIASELFSLIENTIDEVSERTELRRADAMSERPTSVVIIDQMTGETSSAKGRPVSIFKSAPVLPTSQDVLRVAALESAGNQVQTETLNDLFWTVFSKLRAVLEGHRLVYEVTTRLSMRRDLKDPSGKPDNVLIAPQEEILKPLRTEVRTLLHDYLTDQDRGSLNSRRALMSINEVLRDNKLARDRKKALFKFSDTDSKAVGKSVSANAEQLNKALQTSVPGLVTVQENASAANLMADERAKDGAQHKLLVTPNAFNASTLFQPYIVWIQAVRETISFSFSEEELEGYGNYMDDFVAKVYLPQLEEKVTSIFQSNISGPNAFVAEVTPPNISRYPVVKSAIHVLALVNSLCIMLSTTPFSRESYSRLIIGVIVRYYQQCNSHFKDVVMSDPAKLPLAAVRGQREDFISCLDELSHCEPTDKDRLKALGQKESRLESEGQGNKPVDKRELLGTKERFESLSSLCYSLRWLVSQLSRLKILEDEGSAAPSNSPSEIYDIPSAMNSPPNLTLSSAMAQRFDAILLTYTQLADIALYTLRLEVRCRSMFHVHTALSKGNYRSDVEDFEPDPHVMALTGDLTDCDAVAEGRLMPRDRKFIFLQLGTLIDNLLVSYGRTVRYASDVGIYKIKRNILAVQQSLLNVCADPESDGVGLEKAKGYWDLYFTGPKAMLEGIQKNKPSYSFDEYNHMLNLQCKVDPRASMRFSVSSMAQINGSNAAMGSVRAGTGAVDADRNTYNEYLIDLHSLGLEDWKE